MTNREQIFYLHPKRLALGLWLSLSLAAFPGYAVLDIAAAQAETATTESETVEAETVEAEPADTESAASEAAEESAQGGEAEAETNAEAKDSSEGKQETESAEAEKDAAPQEKQEADPQDETSESDDEAKQDSNKQETKENADAEAAEPSPESEPSIEPERTMEVDPPENKTKQPEANKDPEQEPKREKSIIGATATLLEKQSGLKFRARIDSGAKSCSLHVEKITIEDESTKEDVAERMTENIGKVISFVVKNGDGKTHILKRKIASYVIIKTSNKTEGKRRYKVPLTFLWKNMEKEVLVTLNDRRHMEHPLLIGRNFLRDDFLIDVSINSDD